MPRPLQTTFGWGRSFDAPAMRGGLPTGGGQYLVPESGRESGPVTVRGAVFCFEASSGHRGCGPLPFLDRRCVSLVRQPTRDGIVEAGARLGWRERLPASGIDDERELPAPIGPRSVR